MLEEFKKFAIRGNVIDLAVAVVIALPQAATSSATPSNAPFMPPHT